MVREDDDDDNDDDDDVHLVVFIFSHRVKILWFIEGSSLGSSRKVKAWEFPSKISSTDLHLGFLGGKSPCSSRLQDRSIQAVK